jgi:hypothetical protein
MPPWPNQTFWKRERDRLVSAVEPDLDAWSRSVTEGWVGVVAANVQHDAEQGVTQSDPLAIEVGINRVAAVSANSYIRLMTEHLGGIVEDSHSVASGVWSDAVPSSIFIRKRLKPFLGPTAEAQAVGFDTDEAFEEYSGAEVVENYGPIIDGTLDPDSPAARSLVRQFEFPPPSAEVSRGIINNAPWLDGVPWQDRIRTVTSSQASELLNVLSSGIAGGKNIDQLTRDVKESSGLVDWQARRIARTEGVRVAQGTLEFADEQAGDLNVGRRWFSALLRNTRPKHAAQHRREFFRVQSAAGTVVFVAHDGKDPIDKPPIPWEPNCLCWDESILPVDLEAGLPPANFGSPEFAEQLADAGIVPEPKVTPPKPTPVVTDFVDRYKSMQSRIGTDLTFDDIEQFSRDMAKLPKADQIRIFQQEWLERIGKEYPWKLKSGKEAREEMRKVMRRGLESKQREKSVTLTNLSPETAEKLGFL